MAEGFLPPVVAKLLADTSQFNAKMGEARAEMDKTGQSSAALASAGKASFLILGAAAVAVGVAGVKAATEFEAAHARLATAIKNTGSYMGEQSKAVEELDARMRKLGFTDTDVEANLSTLVNATHNTATAVKDMALAADIARARHVDLSTAVGILAKVETGHVSLLGRLGINTKDATGATISQTEAIRRLSEMYGGQASAYAQTFAGKIAQLKAESDHLLVAVGQFLIPIITKLAGVMASTFQFFEKNRTAAIALGVAVGGPLVLAMTAYVVQEARVAASKLADLFETAALKAMYMGQAVASGTAEVAALGTGTLLAGGLILGLGAGALIAAKQLGYFSDAEWQTKLRADALARESLPQMEQALKGLQGAAQKEYDTFVNGAHRTANELAAEKKAVDTTAEAHKAFQGVLAKSVPAAQAFIDAATKAGIKTADWRAELAKHVAQQKTNASSQTAYNELVEQGTADLSTQNVELQKNIDLLEKQANNTISAERSGLDFWDAVKKLTDAQNQNVDATHSAADNAEALHRALLDAEDAAIKNASAIEKASGNTDDYLGALKEQAKELDPASPLRQWLDAYIAKLDEIPAKKATQIDLNFATYGGMADQTAPIGASEGGFVPGSGNGDTVPMMLTPGEFVISKAMLRKGGAFGPSAPSGGGGGGNVTVNVAGSIVGSNPRDIARWLQDMLMAGSRAGVGNGYTQVTGVSAG